MHCKQILLGTADSFVVKLAPTGDSLVYATYFGGSGNDGSTGTGDESDEGNGIAVNDAGEVFVVGTTESNTDFPIVNAAQATYGGGNEDAFVFKLSADGSTILYSTYLGGANLDRGLGIAIDSSNQAVVTGWSNSDTYPTVNAVQATRTGSRDGVVSKLSSDGSQLLFSTFYGGSENERFKSVALDSQENITVVGFTLSDIDLPTVNPLQSTYGGGARDGVVVKLTADGQAISFATYLGGDDADRPKGVAFDNQDNIVVAGQTKSGVGFPIANALQASHGGKWDVFVTRIQPNGTLLSSTYFGNSKHDTAKNVAVDDQDNIHIVGTSRSNDLTLVDEIQSTYNGGPDDVLITKFNADVSQVLFNSYFGGSGKDIGNDIAVDSSGNIFITGTTESSTDFPTLNPFQALFGGGVTDTFVAKIDFQLNQDPIITSTPITTATVGVLYTYDVEADDADQDTLTFALTTFPTGMTIDSASGLIQWTPAVAGNEDVVVEVTDGNGGSDTQSFTINVPVPNQNPTITSTAITTGNVAELYSYDVEASDPDLDTLTYLLNVFPTGMTIDANTGLIQWTPDAEGDFDVTVRVEDGNGGFATQSFTITVGPANQVPTITSTPITNATATVPYSYDVEATDPDLDTLIYSLTSFPAGMTIDSNTGLIQWVPDQLGDHPITVEVSDGRGGLATQSYTLIVTNINQMPTITSTAITTATVDIEYTYDVEATDPDGDTLIYSLTQAPLGMTIDENTGLITWTPANAGSADVTVMVDDGNLNTGQVFTITIAFNPNNQPPGLVPIGDQAANLGQTLTLQLGATDPEGNPVVFGASPLPLLENATLNMETGAFTFTPTEAQVGDHIIKFMATDGRFFDEEEITITVPPNGVVTTFSARVLTLNDAPLEGVRIEIEGQEGLTDVNGQVFVDNIPLAATGKTRVLIDGGVITDSPMGTYATVPEQFNLIQGANNVLPFDMTLLPLDTSAADPVTPFFESIVDSAPAFENGARVTMTVPPNNATVDSTGEFFNGDITISRIEDPADGPAPLPPDIDLSYYIAIQPFGVRYDPPIPISFPNVENFPSGSELDFFALNHDTGAFERIGRGFVSADGLTVDSDGGVVRENSWHGTVPVPASSGQAGAQSPNNQKPNECNVAGNSAYGVKTGNLIEKHYTAPYISLGKTRQIKLVYNSTQANPRPIVQVNTIVGNAAPPPINMSHTVEVGGMDTGGELFFEPPTNPLAPARTAIQFDGSLFASGRYNYTYNFNCNFPISRRTTPAQGQIIVQNDINSEFGAGWTLDRLYRLHFNNDGSVLITSGGGDVWVFDADGSGGFITPDGEYSILVKNIDNSYTRTMRNNTSYQFNANGYLTSKTDRNGNTTSYFYNINNQIERITDPVGLDTLFTYLSSGKVSSITDPAGRETKLFYDSEGNLVEIKDPDSTSRKFDYESGTHLLSAQTDKRGFTSTYEYDFSGRLVKSTKKDGTVVQVSSADTRGLINPVNGNGTEFNLSAAPRSDDEIISFNVDGRGSLSSIDTNVFGQGTTRTDEIGRTIIFDYDDNGNATEITRANGSVVDQIFNSSGKRTQKTENFNSAVKEYTYDAFSLQTSYKNPRNHTTQYNRNSLTGNIESIVNELGHTSTYTYTSQGLVDTIITPNNLTIDYDYNVNGLLERLTETPPVGSPGNIRVATYSYFNTGHMQQIITPENVIINFTYDELSRLTSVEDNLGNRYESIYDENGNVTEIKSIDPDTTLATLVTNEFDNRSRLKKMSMPHQGTTESVFEYILDEENNLVELIDARGNSSKNEFDPAERKSSNTSRIDGVSTYEYDDLDRITKITAPNDVTTEYEYDLLGRKVKEISSDRGTLIFEYDLADNLIEKTDGRGIVTQYTYDELERVETVTFPNTHPGKDENVVLIYDSCVLGVGRLCQIQDESGITSYEYDAFGNIVKETKVELGVTYITEYSYDNDDNLISMTLPSGRQVTYPRDAVRRIQGIDAQINGVNQSIISNIQYRSDNAMTQYTFGNGALDGRTYDLQSRLLTQTLSLGAAVLDSRTYVYDENSNIVSRTTTPQISSYVYDAKDRLTDELIDSVTDIHFDYDLNDNRLLDDRVSASNQSAYKLVQDSNRLSLLDELQLGTSILSTTPEKEYLYNDANRLWRYIEDGEIKAEYIYDAYGLRTRKLLYSAGSVTETIVYHYDLGGRLITETQDDGALIRDYLWGANYSVCAQVDHSAGVDTLFFLHSDHLMTPRFATDSIGAIVWQWESEAFGKTTTNEDPDNNLITTTINLRFPGQYFDSEKNSYYNWHRDYDPVLGRYLQSDPIGLGGGLNTYNYVGSNALGNIDPEGKAWGWAAAAAAAAAAYKAYKAYKKWKKAKKAKDAAKKEKKKTDPTPRPTNPDDIPTDIPIPPMPEPPPPEDEEDEEEEEGCDENPQNCPEPPPPENNGDNSEQGESDEESPKSDQTQPDNLKEQLTMEEAQSGAGEEIMKDRLKDPKYKDTHDKMSHKHDHGDGTSTEVHYWKDKTTGETSDFKYK